MKRTTFIILFLIISCNKQVINEKNSWNALLTDYDIEKAYNHFTVLTKENPEIKKNYLGLAYTQCILDKTEWQETLTKFSDKEEDLWKYGHFATTLRTYLKDKKVNTGLDINEFRALHFDGKFKKEKDFILIEGEYKDLKPFGTWKFYKLNGEFIREENYD